MPKKPTIEMPSTEVQALLDRIAEQDQALETLRGMFHVPTDLTAFVCAVSMHNGWLYLQQPDGEWVSAAALPQFTHDMLKARVRAG